MKMALKYWLLKGSMVWHLKIYIKSQPLQHRFHGIFEILINKKEKVNEKTMGINTMGIRGQLG